jgi:hypothetical protein
VQGRRRSGWDPLVLEQPHPATLRVRDRRLGVCVINRDDFDPERHAVVE